MTEAHYRKLKKKADAEGVLMAEFIRAGVDSWPSVPAGPGDEELRARARETMSKFKSGKKDVARRHDDDLVDDCR